MNDSMSLALDIESYQDLAVANLTLDVYNNRGYWIEGVEYEVMVNTTEIVRLDIGDVPYIHFEENGPGDQLKIEAVLSWIDGSGDQVLQDWVETPFEYLENFNESNWQNPIASLDDANLSFMLLDENSDGDFDTISFSTNISSTIDWGAYLLDLSLVDSAGNVVSFDAYTFELNQSESLSIVDLGLTLDSSMGPSGEYSLVIELYHVGFMNNEVDEEYWILTDSIASTSAQLTPKAA